MPSFLFSHKPSLLGKSLVRWLNFMQDVGICIAHVKLLKACEQEGSSQIHMYLQGIIILGNVNSLWSFFVWILLDFLACFLEPSNNWMETQDLVVWSADYVRMQNSTMISCEIPWFLDSPKISSGPLSVALSDNQCFFVFPSTTFDMWCRIYPLCSLIHAYAVGRDMEEALSCVRKMKEEGIELSLVTYSILVGGFARIGNVELVAFLLEFYFIVHWH